MSSDDILRFAMIEQILRRQWRLLLTLAVMGALLGVVASLIWPPLYESGSRVLLQGTPEKTRVLSEVQLAMSLVVLDRAAAGLNWGSSGSDLRGSVTAEVVDGNVIGITVTAESPLRARRLAEEVTRQYIAFSTEILTQSAGAAAESLTPRRDSLQKQITEADRSIGALQESALLTAADARGAAARAELQRLSSNRTQAVNELNAVEGRIAQVQAQAVVSRQNFAVIESPVEPRTPITRPRPLLIGGGAMLATVLGAVVLVAIRRADRRLRRGADIAAALGGPLLGTVEAPSEGEDSPATNGSHVRYRRVLARMRGSPDESVPLLVITIDGDVPASRAVGRLVAAAGGPSADEVQVGTAAALDIVSVSAARPTIPEPAERAKVLVVVTSGTRTAWELLGVAEACHDAGRPVGGVIMVRPEADAEAVRDLGPGQVRDGAAVGPLGGRTGGDPA